MSSPGIRTAPQRLVFDLTTSAGWIGPPVGIIRTERELAHFAPQVVELPVEYSVFDLKRGVFFRLRPDIARDILEGRATIEFPGRRESVRLRYRARGASVVGRTKPQGLRG